MITFTIRIEESGGRLSANMMGSELHKTSIEEEFARLVIEAWNIVIETVEEQSKAEEGEDDAGDD